MLNAIALLAHACLHSLAVPQAALNAKPSPLCSSARWLLSSAPTSPVKLLKCMQSCCLGAACLRWWQQVGLQPPCWSQMSYTS